MQLTESAHDVVDAFGQCHVSPLDRHRHRFLHHRYDPFGENAPFALAVKVDEPLAIDTRYPGFTDTGNDCFVDPVRVHFALILPL